MTWAFGVGVTVGVGVLLLALLVRFFLDPRAEGWLTTIEDQGWFTAASYKASQGMRVRRGTMLGLLLLAGSGIWTLHLGLSSANQSWQFALPFTGRAVVTRDRAGDVPELRQQLDQQAALGVESPAVTLDRFQLQAYNSQAQAKYVKITDAGLDLYKDEQTVASERRDLFDQARQESPELFENARTFERGSVVAKSEVDAERKQRLEKRQKLQEKGLDEVLAQSQVVPPTDVPIEPASAEVQYTSLTLLPQLRFTLPLLLGALSLWLAWRVVNMPLFADFLVATEAELNKVSWTTRKRLVQDTIVVLVTVVLLCIFLFLADTVWSQLLTGIGVLQPPPRDTTQQAQEQPW
jgi:preprotein translocase SecE subunit